MNHPLMKCGCVAQGHNQNDLPVCVIHSCLEVADVLPDITNRKSRCPYCHTTVKSDFNLPFFQYRPDKETDEHYDGCFGWD